MNEARAAGSLSDDEFRTFLELLRRFCQHDLDQWERWQLNTTYGEVYINISRRPVEGATPEVYDRLEFPDASNK